MHIQLPRDRPRSPSIRWHDQVDDSLQHGSGLSHGLQARFPSTSRSQSRLRFHQALRACQHHPTHPVLGLPPPSRHDGSVSISPGLLSSQSAKLSSISSGWMTQSPPQFPIQQLNRFSQDDQAMSDQPLTIVQTVAQQLAPPRGYENIFQKY